MKGKRRQHRAHGKKCFWCHRQMVTGPKVRQNHPLLATRDHVVPRCENGMNGSRNEVWACQACNNVKGDMSVQQWLDFREANQKWWLLFERQNLRGKRLYVSLILHQDQSE